MLRLNTLTSRSVAGSRNGALVLFCGLLLLSGCELLQQPVQDDPVARQLDEIERRLEALERILASGSLVDLTIQLDELQQQTSELRGRTDSLEYNAEGTSSRQRDLYGDLDDRIQYLERNVTEPPPAPVANAAPTPVALPVPGGSDRQNYAAAFELLKEQQYPAAGVAFRQFLGAFPSSQLAGNAQYWLAETAYVTDKFEEALQEFQVVLSEYPRSRKIPDAYLKIGYSNYVLERWDLARGALERVRDDHPESTAARLANQRLKRMQDEGH